MKSTIVYLGTSGEKILLEYLKNKKRFCVKDENEDGKYRLNVGRPGHEEEDRVFVEIKNDENGKGRIAIFSSVTEASQENYAFEICEWAQRQYKVQLERR
ncbi:MAG: hypothetical protein H6791_02950 [Candidatus Nomurabacteria bacterium]|nr:MAG: hypothetical protein H6791_02950 [Candidatus Nomurabacteria bacterium]